VLVEASGKIAERAYQQSAQSEQPGGAGGASGAEAESGKGDDVVDAEFEEVKEDNK